MPTTTIRLNHATWQYDPDAPIGPEGGFGAVFQGSGHDREPVAVKRLKTSAADHGHRELMLAEFLAAKDLRHVVPVLDAGLDAESDRYFVVMELAERSLQDEIDSKRENVGEIESARVLGQIAAGLIEVGDVVHRDLKPANILFHDGCWKLADFGIARFVEDSTSTNTLRNFLSVPYSAPEQHRGERATPQTDVYALGCVAHALATGDPPFPNHLGREEVVRCHLEKIPAALSQLSAPFRSLVATMLRKTPDARPRIDYVRAALSNIVTAEYKPGGASRRARGANALAEAGAAVAQAEAARDAEQTANEDESSRRLRMATEAASVLTGIVDQLHEAIRLECPNANISQATAGFTNVTERSLLDVHLGDGQLSITSTPYGPDRLAEWFADTNWDVLASAQCSAEAPRYRWSTSLWYAAVDSSRFQWLEVGYMQSSLTRRVKGAEPFAASIEDAIEAARSGLTAIQYGTPIVPIEDEPSTSEFIERWMLLLARAARDQLAHPGSLPVSYPLK
jgi:serine/threonine-protein kinase